MQIPLGKRLGRVYSGRFDVSIQGFTLIELLIVIAIILILIAIALPNFLEAQIRAKVTKAKAEIRTLAIAMDEYYLDFNVYPPESEHDIYRRPRSEQGLMWLTSPIAYITSIPEDPFGPQDLGETLVTYETGGAEVGGPAGFVKCYPCMVTWAIFTRGPDHAESEILSADPHFEPGYNDGIVHSYAPTNGSKSLGDIFQYGGDPFWIGVRSSRADMSLYRKNVAAYDRGLWVDHELYLHRMPPKLR